MVDGVVFFPDGERLASAGADRLVRVRQLDQGSAELVLTGHDSDVLDVRFSPDGEEVLLGVTAGEGTHCLTVTDHGRVPGSRGRRGIFTGVVLACLGPGVLRPSSTNFSRSRAKRWTTCGC